jgi:hypothetical protein
MPHQPGAIDSVALRTIQLANAMQGTFKGLELRQQAQQVQQQQQYQSVGGRQEGGQPQSGSKGRVLAWSVGKHCLHVKARTRPEQVCCSRCCMESLVRSLEATVGS